MKSPSATLFSRYFNPNLPLILKDIVSAFRRQNIEVDIASDSPWSEEEVIDGFSSLKHAKASDISYFADPKYLDHYLNTKSRWVIIGQKNLTAQNPRHDIIHIIVNSAQLAYITLLNHIFPDHDYFNYLGEGARDDNMFPGAIVAKSVTIGANTIIHPGSFIGRGVKIGRHCVIGPNTTILNAEIGDNCIIQPGAVVGKDGYGFGRAQDKVLKIKQLGGVKIGNNVEIGACCTIDRGAIDDTVIGDESKLDNMVHVAHNVVIGRSALIAAQTGIAGSTKVGDGVTMGGQVGIAGHLKIGDSVLIAAKSGVVKTIESFKAVGGYPAFDLALWKRACITLKKLAQNPKMK